MADRRLNALAVESGTGAGTGRTVPALLQLLPGGEQPGPVETAAGLIVLGALVFIILARRGFKPVLAS